MNAPFCSRLSLEAGESLAGTADQVDVWLMLEYRGAWTAQAVTGNSLTGSTKSWLAGLADSYRSAGRKVRLQFIRQQTAGDLRLFTIEGSTTLLRSAVDHEALPMAMDAVVRERLYFVCTHGQRDRCCAEFGMPVYRQLRERLGNRVWQTTHLGGHRYAANVLVTPDAALYGRLAPEDVDAFVALTEAGDTPRRFLRGRTAFDAPAQAAHVLTGERSAWLGTERIDEHRWQVSFSGRAVQIGAREVSGIASCGDTNRKTSLDYFLID